jgi:hypothetical protein
MYMFYDDPDILALLARFDIQEVQLKRDGF